MKNFRLLILAFLILAVGGCKKKKDEVDVTSCVAGLNGQVVVTVFSQHHGHTITNQGWYNDTAYVKFNTSNFPGTDPSLYDVTFVGDSGEDHVHLENLKCGNYFIYCAGWDSTINQRVTGGIPYLITMTGGIEFDAYVNVTN